MTKVLQFKRDILAGEVHLPSSKSISNRLLIMQSLMEDPLPIRGLSEAGDSELLKSLLKSNEELLNAGIAGTTYRFLTAYLAISNRKVTLKGAERMNQRPIGPLVDALRQLGAKIDYLGETGFPPLQIEGKPLSKREASIQADVSSQFISAILLIAPYLKNGLHLKREGKIISDPYVKMTIKLMQELGAEVEVKGNDILVAPGKYHSKVVKVEPDWSSAAYFYTMVALTDNGSIKLKDVRLSELQGDSRLMRLFQELGVDSIQEADGLLLAKAQPPDLFFRTIDFTATPDLVQPYVVCCAALGKSVRCKGVESLRIKETERIKALQTELRKIGAELVEEGKGAFVVEAGKFPAKISAIKTYDDHRMAMSFAAIAVKGGTIEIEDEGIVAKSFPQFWKELEKLGIE